MILVNDLITIYRENGKKEKYKLLCVIKKDYNYIIYTNLKNTDVTKNIYIAKTKNASYLEEIQAMDDIDFSFVKETYLNLLNN